MSLNDRMSNAEAHAHPILLRGEERLEQPVQSIGRYPGAGIPDRDKGLPVGRPRPAGDLAHAVRRLRNGIDPVDDQIQYDLLELDLVPVHDRVPGSKNWYAFRY